MKRIVLNVLAAALMAVSFTSCGGSGSSSGGKSVNNISIDKTDWYGFMDGYANSFLFFDNESMCRFQCMHMNGIDTLHFIKFRYKKTNEKIILTPETGFYLDNRYRNLFDNERINLTPEKGGKEWELELESEKSLKIISTGDTKINPNIQMDKLN